MQSFEDLRIWREARILAVHVYRSTKRYPKSEVFGLRAQMRSAAISIPSRIAEGCGRLTAGERLSFLGSARGSLFELRTQILLSADLGLLDEGDSSQLLDAAERLNRGLSGFITWVRAQKASRAKARTG